MARLHAVLAVASLATFFLPVCAITNSTPIAISSTPVNASAQYLRPLSAFQFNLLFSQTLQVRFVNSTCSIFLTNKLTIDRKHFQTERLLQ
jgi:hypothetical protein